MKSALRHRLATLAVRTFSSRADGDQEAVSRRSLECLSRSSMSDTMQAKASGNGWRRNRHRVGQR
jgi:hypothetical protein